MRFDYGSRKERDTDLDGFPFNSGLDTSLLGLFRSLGNRVKGKTQTGSMRLMEKTTQAQPADKAHGSITDGDPALSVARRFVDSLGGRAPTKG
jgi:hypothetical protein